MRIHLASRNAKKLAEMERILAERGIRQLIAEQKKALGIG